MTTLTPELAGTYIIDASHTRVGFVARHAMVTKVRGHFDDIAGTAVIDPAEPGSSKVDLTIQVASVSTGNPDRDVLAGMIPHHQGAIDMAEVELKHGKDPKVRKLAQDIIKAQKREIAQMQAWLKQMDAKR